MRKLIRILSSAAIAGAMLIVPSVARADHDLPLGTNGVGNNAPSAYHEHPPSPAVAVPIVPCLVNGNVSPGTPGTPSQHTAPSIVNDPSHSHFVFLDALITCADSNPPEEGVKVEADGGNDGHYIDIEPPKPDPSPWPWHHPFDNHHGSTNESAWSNSSFLSAGQGGRDDSDNDEGESNACNNKTLNKNKADIEIDDESRGWLKYIRVGTALYVWGCFNEGPLSTSTFAGIGPNKFFSAALAVFPPAVPPPAAPDFPLCLLPEDIQALIADPASCGFSIAGVAWRGNGWAVDGKAVSDQLHNIW